MDRFKSQLCTIFRQPLINYRELPDQRSICFSLHSYEQEEMREAIEFVRSKNVTVTTELHTSLLDVCIDDVQFDNGYRVSPDKTPDARPCACPPGYMNVCSWCKERRKLAGAQLLPKAKTKKEIERIAVAHGLNVTWAIHTFGKTLEDE